MVGSGGWELVEAGETEEDCEVGGVVVEEEGEEDGLGEVELK